MNPRDILRWLISNGVSLYIEMTSRRVFSIMSVCFVIEGAVHCDTERLSLWRHVRCSFLKFPCLPTSGYYNYLLVLVTDAVSGKDL